MKQLTHWNDAGNVADMLEGNIGQEVVVTLSPPFPRAHRLVLADYGKVRISL